MFRSCENYSCQQDIKCVPFCGLKFTQHSVSVGNASIDEMQSIKTIKMFILLNVDVIFDFYILSLNGQSSFKRQSIVSIASGGNQLIFDACMHLVCQCQCVQFNFPIVQFVMSELSNDVTDQIVTQCDRCHYVIPYLCQMNTLSPGKFDNLAFFWAHEEKTACFLLDFIFPAPIFSLILCHHHLHHSIWNCFSSEFMCAFCARTFFFLI